MAVTVGVGGNKARPVGDKPGGLVHHIPVEGARFSDDNEIRIDIGNGESGFVQLMDQRAFTDDKRFLPSWRLRKSAVAIAEV